MCNDNIIIIVSNRVVSLKLKLICAPPIRLKSLPTTDQLIICTFFPFPDCIIVKLYSMKPIQIGFFH